MSEVLHYTPPSATAAAIINRHDAFRAKINAIAKARKVVPIKQAEPVIVTAKPKLMFTRSGCTCPTCRGEPQDPKHFISIKAIQKAVCGFYGISDTDIKSARRTAKMVRPRQIAFYLCKTLTTRTLPEIGRLFGGRDHTTVLHGVRKIEALVQFNPELEEQIQMLKEQLA